MKSISIPFITFGKFLFKVENLLLAILILTFFSNNNCGVAFTEEVRHHRASCRREQVALMPGYNTCLEEVGTLDSKGEINTRQDCDDYLNLLIFGYLHCEDTWPDGQKIWVTDSIDEL